ncbi:MAG: glycine cleavage system protein GcvH [Candidatus Methanofastidiosa archaeon]|nr:glycine cleavage system protein GcvH [Candidatus Methanofastidiosa archaeon]
MFVGEYEIKEGLKYTKAHEWIEIIGDVISIGVTDYASKEMGDVAFVELPKKGKDVGKGELLCEIESVKAVSEIESPVKGRVSDVNEELEDTPEMINEDPYGTWMVKIRYDGLPGDLLSDKQYASLLETMEK